MNIFDTVRNLNESLSPGEEANEASTNANASSMRGDHFSGGIHHKIASDMHNTASSVAKDKNVRHYHSIMSLHHADLSNFHHAAADKSI